MDAGRRAHRFYGAAAGSLLAFVVAGFARTYYLKRWYGGPPLPALLHLHGAVMTTWFVSFAVQVKLVAKRHVALHRALGWAGIALAGLVAVLGVLVSAGLARRELLLTPNSTHAPFLLALQLFAILLVFAVLVCCGVYYRAKPDYHKRFMTMSMVSVLGPALTRLPVPFLPNHNAAVSIALMAACVLSCAGVDTCIHRRLHPAFLWSGALMTGVVCVVAPMAMSPAWSGIVRRLLL